MEATPLVEVTGLTKHFPVTAGLLRRVVGHVKAVDDVSFHIDPGETLGLVGESGCGKTTTGRLMLRLIERTRGSMFFDHEGEKVDLGALGGESLRRFRRHMQLVFQDPFSSLNPRMTVMNIVGEPLRAQGYTRKETRDRVFETMEDVKLPRESLSRYPHAFSGGQRQRICIARALVLRPTLVVCDEPVSALDVSVQAQVLNLLMDLQDRHGLTYLFIAHDLSVVEHISKRVAVMYAGRLVEVAPTSNLFSNALHPYTKALLRSVPKPMPERKGERYTLEGEVADPGQLPQGCSFHPRCSLCADAGADAAQCRTTVPELRTVADGRTAACHLLSQITAETPAN